MSKKITLHPSVQEFKKFVKKHPKLAKEVKEGRKSWQDFFEEWTILGEKDEIWQEYLGDQEEQEEEIKNESEEKSESEKGSKQGVGDLLSMLKSINLNEIQGHIQNLSGVMTTVQGLLQSFQGNSQNQQSEQGQQQQQQQQQGQQHPFNFRQF